MVKGWNCKRKDRSDKEIKKVVAVQIQRKELIEIRGIMKLTAAWKIKCGVETTGPPTFTTYIPPGHW